MIINHNLGAMNANRNMGINSTNAGKSMEKLSSGLRINKAGDDAAGLAISEKMRGQIRGLDQASANSQDAISLLQTTEGSLSETHSILQRMRELSVQSASDTATAPDRKNIQTEVDQLAKEITRISNTSEFNTKNLLAGGFDSTFQIGANAGQNLNVKVSAMDAKSLGVAGNLSATSVDSATKAETAITGISTSSEGINGTFVISKFTAAAAGTITAGTINGAITDDTSLYTGSSDKTFTVKIMANDGTATPEATQLNYSTDGGLTWAAATNTAAGKFTLAEGVKIDINAGGALGQNAVGSTGSIAFTAEKLTFALTTTDGAVGGAIGAEVAVHNNQSSVTIGNSVTDQEASVSFNFAAAKAATTAAYAATHSTQINQTVSSSSAATTGSDGSVTVNADTKAGINVSTQAKADLAITTINSAIETVSAERSKLGAFTNRLEHTIANLGTSSENLTSAESRIRDVNMAKEMSTFSKNNILAQAAQAMLAQANQQPQQVLQLLR
jgi:flagellin